MKDNDTEVHLDPYWKPVYRFIDERKSEQFILPPFIAFKDYDNGVSYLDFTEINGFDYFVLYKGLLLSLDFHHLDLILGKKCVYANGVFAIFDLRHSRTESAELPWHDDIRSVHQDYFDAKSEVINSKKLVFLHIPKCAGTSLYERLRRQSARSLYVSGANAYLKKKKGGFDHLNILAGHFSRRNIIEKFAPGTHIDWVTILRNPVDRLLSMVQHARRSDIENYGPAMVEMREKPMSELLDTKKFFNQMHISFICLSDRRPQNILELDLQDVAQECLDFLAQDNVIFGFQDSLNDIPKLLNMKLGYNLDIPKQLNTAGGRQYEKSIDDVQDVLGEIKKKLEVDFWFYEEAQKLHARRFAKLLES